MKYILSFLVSTTIIFSCGKKDIRTDVVNTLCILLQEHNNTKLIESKKYTDEIILSSKNGEEKFRDNQIVKRLNRLIELNNVVNYNCNDLLNFILSNNDSENGNCELKNNIDCDNISSRSEYLIELNKIINNTCLSLGTFCCTVTHDNYAVDNRKFRIEEGENLVVPIRFFPRKTTGNIEYELFDTLNFKRLNAKQGEFIINSPEKDKTESVIHIYGKDILTKRTNKIGTVKVEYEYINVST